MHNYKVYGLNVESTLALPELLPSNDRTSSDVVVRTGDVPDVLEDVSSEGVLYQINDRHFRLAVDGVARYLVSEGKEIVVQPEPGADEQSTRLFLLGSALGALLHQRGILPLHGSCIETPKGAVVFVGNSGVGKSTTAAAFLKRGYPVLADDITVITPSEDGNPVVTPGYPQMKLWGQSLKKLGETSDSLERVRPSLEKFAVPLHQNFRSKSLPLHAIYALNTHNMGEFEMIPIKGLKKVSVLKNHTYRHRYMDGIHENKGKLVELAQQVRICRVKRPSHGFMLDELVEVLEKDFSK